jgi:hypothetical protein
MSLNVIWSILAKGNQPSGEFSRRAPSGIYKQTETYTPVIDSLVPFGDNLLRSFRIEQLVQLVLSSDLRDRALELDPVNTYEKCALTFPAPSSTATPTEMDILFFEEAVEQTEGFLNVHCTVNPTFMTLTTEFGVETFSHTNNLSSLIDVAPGKTIRLQGTLPVSPFSFVITYIAETKTDWPAVIATLESQSYQFTDVTLRRIFSEDINWVNRVSAIVLLAAENSRAAV